MTKAHRYAAAYVAVALATGCGAPMRDGGSARATPESPPMAAPAEASRDGDGIPDAPADEIGASHADAVDAKTAPPPPPGAPKPAPAQKPQSGTNAPQNEAQVAASRAPILIYTADLTLAVFEVEKQLASVEALGRDVGGFLARRDDQSITIRVPVARFDEAVAKIEKLGDVLHRNVTAEDVTEEFRDLEVRLRSLRAVRERLEALLAKATKVEESVAIEKELDRVAGEIDRIEGRMKYLRDRAEFSTITVRFSPKNKETVGATTFRLPAPWLDDLGLGRLLKL